VIRPKNRPEARIAVSVLALVTVFLAAAYRFWPRKLVLPACSYPSVRIEDGRIVAPFPTRVLLARVGEFDDPLSSYLWFDYLRSRSALRRQRVFVVNSKEAEKKRHEILIELPNDAVGSVSLLSGLEAKGYFDGFDLLFSSAAQAAAYEEQTKVLVASYQNHSCGKLEALSREQLQSSVARFIVFKSQTDARARDRTASGRLALSDAAAAHIAADIIAVAKFYNLPLAALLGIGAMENNYLAVDGDLQHTVWKRRALKDDIVLERRRRKALVSDYSMGAWQISRETLRRAHSLYLKDGRDYTALPPRLRPTKVLDLNSVDPDVMTTYAGLLLRGLLDRFHGDVPNAVGAYNGGPRRPNLRYASGVRLVASYADNVLACGAADETTPANPSFTRSN